MGAWNNLRVEFNHFPKWWETEFFFVVDDIYVGKASDAFGSIYHCIIPIRNVLPEGAVCGGVVPVLLWVEVARQLREGLTGLQRLAPVEKVASITFGVPAV